MGRANIDKTCLSKTRYETEQEAREYCQYLFETYDLILFPYKCPLCQGFHLTSGKKLK